MNDPALLRRVAMALMIVAILAGTFSLYKLFASPISDPVWLITSVTTYLLGTLVNRRAVKIDKAVAAPPRD